MTVSSNVRKAGPFLGNGVTTAFPFTFKVFTTADLTLTRTDASGNDTVLALGSDYSIALNADQDNNPGGTIAYPVSGSPLAAGLTLTGIGSLAASQGTDITNAGRFLPQVVEDAFDRLTILAQQVLEKVNRGLGVPVNESSIGALPTLANRIGKYLAFDASGNPTPSAGTGADAGLRTDLAASGGAALISLLQGDTGSVAILLQAFLRGLFVTPGQFGATANGLADDSSALQKALSTGKHVYLAGGVTYYCPSTITMSVAGTVMFGPGTLKFNAAAAAGSTLLSITADRCTVDGITVDMQSANTGRAITPINTDGCTIRSVRFLNGGQFNIRASGTVRNLKVLHCTQQTQGYMVLIQDPSANSYGFEAVGNVFEHPAAGQGDCIEINAPTNGFTDFVITGNRITGAFGTALVAGIGIGVANGQRGTISDNIVTNCEGDGIHVEDRSKSISILGNTVTGCTTSLTTTTGGISVANSCQDIEIDGNTVNATGSQRPGIATFSTAGTTNLNITISNNVVDSSPKEGMSLDSITVGHVRGNTITNPNTTNTATIAGIRFPGFSNVTSRVQMRGNTIVQGTNPVRSVIFATPAKATQCTVADNDFTGCTTPSIDDGTNAVDRFGNRMSTDSMYGTLTLTAGTATTVANGNTNTIQNIVLTPSNAAARALGVPFVASIVSGTSFTLTSAVAAGTETYSYRIL